MKVYSPADVATQLEIKESTLRKYSLLLEEAGMKFQRNSQNQRWYNDNDVIALRKLVTLKNNGDMTLKECADAVFLWIKGQDVTLADMEYETPHNDTKERNADITELKEMVQKQNELIEALTVGLSKQQEQMNKQQEYIKESLERRDRELIQAIRESQQLRLEAAATKQPEEKKKTLWQRLTGK